MSHIVTADLFWLSLLVSEKIAQRKVHRLLGDISEYTEHLSPILSLLMDEFIYRVHFGNELTINILWRGYSVMLVYRMYVKDVYV